MKCNEGSQDICFETDYGCCDILSSHDWNNVYAFMGGLASNILAMWGMIKMLGYLIVHADPALATYVKRRKR